MISTGKVSAHWIRGKESTRGGVQNGKQSESIVRCTDQVRKQHTLRRCSSASERHGHAPALKDSRRRWPCWPETDTGEAVAFSLTFGSFTMYGYISLWSCWGLNSGHLLGKCSVMEPYLHHPTPETEALWSPTTFLMLSSFVQGRTERPGHQQAPGWVFFSIYWYFCQCVYHPYR